ncbi:hypothetical protein [Nonomuraea sp. GTA35]|uniref:hypothetical protein n=1 Tax=Nonomuraea sp. GTA35 TaxID=1676746 RepID=UPI0035C21785
MSTLVKIVVVLSAASTLVTGFWARVDPAGFAAWAGWPNLVHFLHDAGLFQIGIGLLLAFSLVGLAGLVARLRVLSGRLARPAGEGVGA